MDARFLPSEQTVRFAGHTVRRQVKGFQRLSELI